MLATRRSIGHDGVDIPGVVRVYDRPSCVLLSCQTACVRSEVQLCHHSGEDAAVERTYFGEGILLGPTRH
jgi:hypothetical protein